MELRIEVPNVLHSTAPTNVRADIAVLQTVQPAVPLLELLVVHFHTEQLEHASIFHQPGSFACVLVEVSQTPTVELLHMWIIEAVILLQRRGIAPTVGPITF